MRGYFGIGIEGVTKPLNIGGLLRTAHAFGASFVFTVAARYPRRAGGLADTSDAPGHVPFYAFPDVQSLLLPQGCSLVGVELVDDAIELPSFRHPRQAAYVLGPERGSLSPALQERCDHLIRIPTQFCVNVGIAGAIVMYDRMINLGRFARRAGLPGGPVESLPEPVFGGPFFRTSNPFRDSPPLLPVSRGAKRDSSDR